MKLWPLPEIVLGALEKVEERRDAALVTTGPAWEAVRGSLRLRTVAEARPAEATEAAFEAVAAACEGEVVVAVGGGLAMDAGKWAAWRRGLPLVAVPTALTTDAWLTWASGVRVGGCVRYPATRPPDRVYLDLELVARAPARVRALGAADVLSIATALHDWRHAGSQGRLPPGERYLPHAARVAAAILDGLIEAAPAIGRGDPAGMRLLADLLCLEVALCNQIGHSRPEEGSEHQFVYALENRLPPGPLHGALVALGILLMARLQGQEESRLRAALNALGIAVGPPDLPPDALAATLVELPEYARRHALPYTVLHDWTPDEAEIGRLITGLA